MAPCPRCHGYIHVDLTDEPRCLQCSYRPPLVPKVVQYRVEIAKCLCGKNSQEGTGICRYCRYEGHGDKIRRGMKAQRDCKYIMPDNETCGVRCLPGLFYCTEHRSRIRVRSRKVGAQLPIIQEAQR